MELTTLHVDTVMSQDGGPASGISPTKSSPDDALATVGYVKSKVLGLDNVDVNVSTLQSKLSQLDTQLTNIETSALTRAQYGALKDELMADINRIVAAGDDSAGQAIANLQQQLQQANANITTLNQRNATLNANIKSLQLEIAELNATIESLRAQIAQPGAPKPDIPPKEPDPEPDTGGGGGSTRPGQTTVGGIEFI